ncbi:MAG: DUF4199 domain-containing protein [Bacteroidales bacterium]|nr:DUF4199 domain-containing protein [Bacteroidales bacterium]
MYQTEDRNDSRHAEAYASPWASAARDGLLLALVTIAISSISIFVKEMPGFLGIITWLVKTVGSIYLLVLFVKSFLAGHQDASAFGYSIRICLFSSLIIAAFTFVQMQYIQPDVVSEAFDQAIAQMGAQLDSDSIDQLNRISDNPGRIMSIITFFWDMLLGLLASAIISSALPRPNPFGKTDTPDQQDELL